MFSFCVNVPGSSFIDLRAVLNVLSNRSALPLDKGWYARKRKCRMPSYLQNVAYSSEMYGPPLSETISFGIPNLV